MFCIPPRSPRPNPQQSSALLSNCIQNLTTFHLSFFFNNHLSPCHHQSSLICIIIIWSPDFCTCPNLIYSHIAANLILLEFQTHCVAFPTPNTPVAIHHIPFKNQLSDNRLQSPLTFSSFSSILFRLPSPPCSSKRIAVPVLHGVCSCSVCLLLLLRTSPFAHSVSPTG